MSQSKRVKQFIFMLCCFHTTQLLILYMSTASVIVDAGIVIPIVYSGNVIPIVEITIANTDLSTIRKHQRNVLKHMEQPICIPHIQRPWKRHSLCSGILHTEAATVECPVHCPSTEALQRLCGVQIHENMENTDSFIQGSDSVVYATVNSDADVYMNYFDYTGIDFFKEPPSYESRSRGILASFVSNCVQWRLDYLNSLTAALIALNETVHNYGPCANNIPDTILPSGDKYKQKEALGGRYKFVFAFENSETPGYITEKLWYSISDGLIPVYRGATNVMQYLPSPSAAVVVKHTMAPDDLAVMLVRAAYNKQLYEERFKWKQKPPLSWVLKMDIGTTHSHCRVCIRILDMERPHQNTTGVLIRERGTFEFVLIPQIFTDFLDLCLHISSTFNGTLETKPEGSGAVALLYRLWDRNKCSITTIREFNELENSSELEVVLENINWSLRGESFRRHNVTVSI
jgi:Glycosyltransferase family 10 (fucosyltransferase) C-term